MQFQVDEFAGENGAQRPIANVGAAELFQDDDYGQDFIVEIVLEDAVFEALGPLEVKVYEIVLL